MYVGAGHGEPGVLHSLALALKVYIRALEAGDLGVGNIGHESYRHFT